MKDFKFNDRKLDGKSINICAIINVTPDSFSDGGAYNSLDKALHRAKEFYRYGVKFFDIGGESTRPHSNFVEIDNEIERILPVIKNIKSEMPDAIISVDTWKSEVAKAAIEAGADIINDITGLLGDPNMASVISNSKVGCILMFNPTIIRPNHKDSQKFPKFTPDTLGYEELMPFLGNELREYRDKDILDLLDIYLDKSLGIAKDHNIEKDRIMLDPGIGFGLTYDENLKLLKNINLLKDRDCFTFLGVSRKRFLMNIVEDLGFESDIKKAEGLNNSDLASAILTSYATMNDVEVIRVHSLKEHLISSKIITKIKNS